MKENNLPIFIEDLSNYLTVIKNLSKTYITNHKVTLEQFLQFINVHKLKNRYESIIDMSLNDIRGLNNSDVYSFIYFLAESNYKTNSRVVKIEHLRTFFNYLYSIKHNIFTQPFKQIKTERKIEKKIPNYLSLTEAQNLLKVYANSENPLDIRNNAMLHLFLNCGLRISEVASLNISDLILEEDKFIIHGKGNRERVGYLNKATKKALEEYLKIRQTIDVASSKQKDALFLNKDNVRISIRGIRKKIKIAYELANINGKQYSAHTLRHTCATLMYRSGIDIKTIQELLGHSQIDTTNVYVHTYNQEVKNAMLDFPLSDFKMADAMEYCAA